MEDMVIPAQEQPAMNSLFSGIYQGRKVLITGHTGFKGSWLAFWLQKMGANVCGYSLAPETDPNHFSLLDINTSRDHQFGQYVRRVRGLSPPETGGRKALPYIGRNDDHGLNTHSVIADILDFQKLTDCFQTFQPEIVFHLAAQSLVRRSYRQPLGTFETNVMGTANVLEAARSTGSVEAVVVVTSDKCYRNNEWEWGYRESDPMGGHDPYSASKGCAELVTAAFRDSFFTQTNETQKYPLIATVRAGNVIGGGDWAEDRLIPDVIRAASRKEKVKIRNPHATRPWQHVLEPLSGYLMLGQQLLEGNSTFADAWNFGPSDDDALTVREVMHRLKTHWTGLDVVEVSKDNQPHEAGMLKLDSSRARQSLGWRPVWNCGQAIEQTMKWYQAFYEKGIVSTGPDLAGYVEAARSMGMLWAR